MTLPVHRIDVHHEGSGAPRQVDLGDAGYTAGVFPGGHDVWRTPETDFSTFGHNHVSMGVVLTGNRMNYVVTPEDIDQVCAIVDAAVKSGWVSPDSEVYPHGTLYPPPTPFPSGSSPTQCPGIKTIDVWGTLYNRVHDTLRGGPTPTPTPPTTPKKGTDVIFTKANKPAILVTGNVGVALKSDEYHAAVNAGVPTVQASDRIWTWLFDTHTIQS